MFHNVEQNTDEWLDMRIGKVTGSAVSKIMANYGKSLGEPAKKYAVTIARERVTGKRSIADGYTNAHMQRGHDQEPIARMLYEDNYFVDVDNGGFFDNGNTGCSPDGLVYGDGVVEIKSVIDNVHYANIKRGGVDPSYKWQLAFNLKETGRDWIDFVSYCADFPENTRLYVHRLTVDDCADQFKMIDLRLAEYEELIKQCESVIKGNQ